MTISATCPKGHTLTLEEKLAGKKIRCPRCQVVFEVPHPDDDDDVEEAEAVSEKPTRKASRPRDDDDDDDDEDDRPRGKARPAAPADDDDDEESMDDETRRKLDRQLKKKALGLVDFGLLFHSFKVYAFGVGVLFGALLIILLTIHGAHHTDKAAEAKGLIVPMIVCGDEKILGSTIDVVLLFVLNLFIALIGPLFGVVSCFMCWWIPKKSEGRGSVLVSLIFDVSCIIAWLLWVLTISDVFGMLPAKKERMVLLLLGAIGICVVVSWLLFLSFQRTLGKYVGDARLGNQALNRIVGLAIQVVFTSAMITLNVAGATLMGGVVGIALGMGSLFAWMVFFVLYFYLGQLRLLAAMREAVQNKL